MKNSPVASLEIHFQNLTAPRAEHSIDHLLIDIVIITICAVICGANNWVEIDNNYLTLVLSSLSHCT